MEKVTQNTANKVLAFMVSNHFFDNCDRPKSDRIKEGTYNVNGTETITLANGQRYEFSVRLID